MARTRLATLARHSETVRVAPRASRWSVLVLSASLCPLPLMAQTAPAPGSETPEEEVIRLSPFQVVETEDVGYRATNTTSGTSLNTAIKDLPMTIQVVTAEFINDIGATDFTEALAYASGVFTESLEA